MDDLVLGVNLGVTASGDQLLTAARTAEAAGLDVVTVADHLGSQAPFSVLAAAAAVTERVRLRTYVLNVFFWNPALLAREAANVDVISGGRLEVGLGAGHLRAEHENAGIPFPPHAERVVALERTMLELRRRLTDPEHTPAPIQREIPLLVGAWGERSLRVAAEHADIVALSGLAQVPGRPAGTFTMASAAQTAERVDLLRVLLTQHRGVEQEAPGLDAILQFVEVGRDPAEAAGERAAQISDGATTELLLDTPFALFARTADDAVDELKRRRDEYGITQWMTHARSATAMMAVARALHGH
ncbi:MAG: TIGR03621 family F420-dependent LLM class oxidoreductase [Jiangellaceae bacterium]